MEQKRAVTEAGRTRVGGQARVDLESLGEMAKAGSRTYGSKINTDVARLRQAGKQVVSMWEKNMSLTKSAGLLATEYLAISVQHTLL